MNIDYFILFLVIVILLLGLPIIFLFIVLKKVYHRFSELENTLNRIIREMSSDT
ncbi:MAG: hypothetical protein V2J62_07115 [candidate division KSB1 bacterium]|jgi:hypothetical protein|nr:hypothetical protein [candidate division KSB1 bacterium]